MTIWDVRTLKANDQTSRVVLDIESRPGDGIIRESYSLHLDVKTAREMGNLLLSAVQGLEEEPRP